MTDVAEDIRVDVDAEIHAAEGLSLHLEGVLPDVARIGLVVV